MMITFYIFNIFAIPKLHSTHYNQEKNMWLTIKKYQQNMRLSEEKVDIDLFFAKTFAVLKN